MSGATPRSACATRSTARSRRSPRAGRETPRLDAELLLADALGDDARAAAHDPDARSTGRAVRAFQTPCAAAPSTREPVAYILGRRGFRRIELAVDPRVLIPRPETELLVEVGLALPRGARVLDFGTGSGAIALALADERPDLRVSGTDLNGDALAVARANGERLGLEVELAARRPARRAARRVGRDPLQPAVRRRRPSAPAWPGDLPPRAARGAGRRRRRPRRDPPADRQVADRRGAAARARGRRRAGADAVAELLRAAGFPTVRAGATSRASSAWSWARSVSGDELDRCEARAGRVVAGGGVAVFGADTVYGLGCDPRRRRGRRLYELKGRPRGQAGRRGVLQPRCRARRAARPGPPHARRVPRAAPWSTDAAAAQPGAALPAGRQPDPERVLLGRGRSRWQATGRRGMPPRRAGPGAGRPARRAAAIAAPALQSSANFSGESDPCRLSDVPIELRSGADLVIDGGASCRARPRPWSIWANTSARADG